MKKYLKILIYAGACLLLITAVFSLFRYKSGRAKVSFHKRVPPKAATALLDEAESLKKQGNLVAARRAYQKAVDNYPDIENFPELQNEIYDLNIRILFSPAVTPGSRLYQVVSGDSLEKIAKKFNTTIELVKKANNLKSDLIRQGMKLKVQNNTFSIVADKSQNRLTLVSGEDVIKVYTISTGKANCTPTGTFKIVNKLIDPSWYSAGKGVVPPDSPENILGTRWLGIDESGYGIHGTDDSGTIGYQCTQGCIRMHNADVEELYAIVPTGTEVTIID